MAIGDTYRQGSRREWTPGDGVNLNREQVAVGCLQRIADATEKMAGSYAYLIDRAQRLTEENARLKKQLAGVRGEITKLRKAQNATT